MTKLSLYQFKECSYCRSVKDYITEHSLDVPLRDIKQDATALKELLDGGGKSQVPCLRIDEGSSVRWLYESRDIIAFLREHKSLTFQDKRNNQSVSRN